MMTFLKLEVAFKTHPADELCLQLVVKGTRAKRTSVLLFRHGNEACVH